MNGLEIYNEILQNTHSLKGTWEVTAENYLKVDGMTNGSIVLFDQTVGALGDFILEWTAEQKGGSYIHSNLCPSLRYTPEDAGIEGGGDNYALLVYLCNYGGNTGTFNLRTDGGTKSEVNASTSLNIDTVYSFRFERLNGVYKLYQDGVLINTATDITKRKLYLGWYLWYGGSNASYQTNFILREYKLTKVDTRSYLDTIGLTTLWSKIKSLFATKTELGSKANDSDVVHKTGDETITGSKTFDSLLTCSSTVAILGTSTDKYLSIQSGNSWDNGGRLSLYGKEHSENSGQCEFTSFDSAGNANIFRFSVDGFYGLSVGGTLNLGTPSNKWNNIYSRNCNVQYIYAPTSTESLFIHGGTSWQDGSRLELSGSNRSDNLKGCINLIALNPNSSGEYDQSNVCLDPYGNFYPYYFTSNANLGTSNNKWKTINGINPGALSLPSNNAVNILSALQSGGYTTPSNGYVRAIKNVQTECSSTFGIRNETTGIEDRRITERVFVLGVIVPVQAGEKVIISNDWNSVSNATITYSASFYPCKGNV